MRGSVGWFFATVTRKLPHSHVISSGGGAKNRVDSSGQLFGACHCMKTAHYSELCIGSCHMLTSGLNLLNNWGKRRRFWREALSVFILFFLAAVLIRFVVENDFFDWFHICMLTADGFGEKTSFQVSVNRNWNLNLDKSSIDSKRNQIRNLKLKCNDSWYQYRFFVSIGYDN